jgi:alpha-1,2-mannosyltransferase
MDGAGAPAGWRGRSDAWAVAALAAIYLGSAALCCRYAALSKADFVDLHVYRMGAGALWHGGDLYQLRYYWLSFTYPPFAAVMFVPAAAVPFSLAAAVLTAGSVLALPATLYLALRLPSPVTQFAPRNAIMIALAAAAAAVWLEPVRTMLTYGQVDLWIDAAILCDLSRPDSSRWKGAAIGIVAGIKLTPAIFAGYLLVTRRFRAAATAAGTFAVTLVIGFLAFPGSSARYWGGMFLNPRHIGQVSDVENQSLLGAMARTFHAADPRYPWLAVAALVAAAGLTLAAWAQRHGDEAGGFSLCAVTALLVSPISWSHHWVLAIPALLLAAVAIYRGRARRPVALTVLGTAAILGLAIAGWTRLARSVPGSGWLHLSARALLYSEIYVLAGLAVLALAAYSTVTLLARLRGLSMSRPELRGHVAGEQLERDVEQQSEITERLIVHAWRSRRTVRVWSRAATS